ncbi:alpha/beta hydrolase [Marinicella sp. S1101]|uniref:alpha/beta hydrolase family protein n=1 Tax=Marinicella marina TaxID=2996016 RepID=UPI002260B041|nr:alpha/beta hydrolase [Marinicella marina]MCX7554394.1 alpha/beta hydrolase [Marinicella marina]MDJ1138615.1 alpha/beta hydrolase [Marinicella marina]
MLATALPAAAVEEQVTFESNGDVLAGSILWPAEKITAAVVFVHGSGKQTRNIKIAERFAQDGIAALVYDKRGVGESGGQYEAQQSVSGHNIKLLADDALAALKVLQQHPKLKGVRIGLSGISQAGWIVPLAAEQAKAVDFMVVWSGPVTKVSEEDIYSKYTQDHDGADLPSFAEALAARKSPYVWPDFLGVDTNPKDSLEKLQVPSLWVFGAQDGSIPVNLSISRIKDLIQTGKPIEYVLFSALGHNNMVETFATVTDWINRFK